MNRRTLLASLIAASCATIVDDASAEGLTYYVSRDMSRTMAKKYKLNGDQRAFDTLFGVQDAFRGIKAFPRREHVIFEGLRSLKKVLDGQRLDKRGFRNVVRRSDQKVVIFSDHHILPSSHRQSAVWRANRDPYVKVLRHYGESGYLVVENGDVEELVILEPSHTLKAYAKVYEALGDKKSNPLTLLKQFRQDPLHLEHVMRLERGNFRRQQLLSILKDPHNRAYYDTLSQLSGSQQLLRLAGNHDYQLQEFDGVPDHLVPADVMILGTDRPTVVMHGHQFDAVTNPAVAPFCGEVISECLGVFYQGPDRYWSPHEVERMVKVGFPNRLSTHPPHTSAASSFISAMMASEAKDDEEWASAWEALLGHPIAWEYGASNWNASVRSGFARPGNMIENAMAGRQFFKCRHLDEWDLVQGLQEWGVPMRLALGHSHEVRNWTVSEGEISYCNSGAAGRFARLIWALEIDSDQLTVVGWHATDKVERYRFDVRETDLFSYFEPRREGTAL